MGQFVWTNKDRYNTDTFRKTISGVCLQPAYGPAVGTHLVKKYCLNYDILVAFYPLYMLQHKVKCLYENVGIFDKAKN